MEERKNDCEEQFPFEPNAEAMSTTNHEQKGEVKASKEHIDDTEGVFQDERKVNNEKDISATEFSATPSYSAQFQTNIDKVEELNINNISADGKIVPEGAIDPLSKPQSHDLKWHQLCNEKDDKIFDFNLQYLSEEYICFISSTEKTSRWALVYHILMQGNFSKKQRKQIYFSNNKRNQYFGLYDLILSLSETSNLFIVVDLEYYKKDKAREAFLDSATKQRHNQSMEILERNNIHIVILISKTLSDEINSEQNDRKRLFNIWEIYDTPPETVNEPDIPSLFGRLNPIEKQVLFVGAAFPKLSFRDFAYVIDILLENTKPGTQVVLDTYKSYADGAKLVKEVYSDGYQDIWHENSDQFMKNCHLAGKNEDGVYIVNTKYPGFRNKVIEYLKENQHFFWQKQCDCLEERKLIFNPNISVEISKSTIDLAVEALSDDPDHYSDSWFLEIMFAIQIHDGQDYQIRGGTPKEQVINLFADLNEREELTRFFYSQLSYFLRKLIEKGLSEHVNGLLDSLISFGLHKQLLILAKSISANEMFDKYYWIKQLIERASSEIKNEAYRWLVYSIAVSKPIETIEIVKNWLPLKKPIQNYSPSNHYSAYFFIHFYVVELASVRQMEFTSLKTEISILINCETALDSSKNLIADFIKLAFTKGTIHQFAGDNSILIAAMRKEMMLYPCSKNETLRNLLGVDDDNTPQRTIAGMGVHYEKLVADIVENWYFTISSQQTIDDNIKSALLSYLCFCLFEFTELKTLNGMIDYWQQRPNLYRLELEKVNTRRRQSMLTEDEYLAIDEFAQKIAERNESLIHFFDTINLHLITKNKK